MRMKWNIDGILNIKDLPFLRRRGELGGKNLAVTCGNTAVSSAVPVPNYASKQTWYKPRNEMQSIFRPEWYRDKAKGCVV